MHLRVCFALSFCLYASSAFAIPILTIQPPSTTVVLGDTFSLNISVTDAFDLYAFQFDLGFDPTVLSATSPTEGPFLATGGATFFIPGTINPAGSIDFTANSLQTATSGVNGSGVLATVNFTALAAGTSPINLFNVTLLDSQLAGIVSSTQPGAVAVVPEPTSLLLVGTGLFFARRSRRARRFRSACESDPA